MQGGARRGGRREGMIDYVLHLSIPRFMRVKDSFYLLVSWGETTMLSMGDTMRRELSGFVGTEDFRTHYLEMRTDDRNSSRLDIFQHWMGLFLGY